MFFETSTRLRRGVGSWQPGAQVQRMQQHADFVKKNMFSEKYLI
jgi:hypothetical protein